MTQPVATTLQAPVFRQGSSRVLLVTTSTGIGGTEKIVFELARFLQRRGAASMVCSLKAKGHYAQLLEAQGIPVCSLMMNERSGLRGTLAMLRALLRLVRTIRSYKPEIVHAFLFRANLLARVAGPLCGVQVNLSSIRTIEQQRHYYFLLERLTAPLVTRYVAVSEKVKDISCRLSRLSPHRVEVIPNGIECSDDRARSPEKARAALRRSLSIPPAAPVCGTLARLVPEKGVDRLIESFALVKTKLPDAWLVIIGDGPEKARLERLARERGLGQSIVFLGMQSQPRVYLELLDAFALPSLVEGMSNALLEAMSAGIPVVATSVGGTPEVILHEQSGLLVPPDDCEALARSLQTLLTQTEVAQRLTVSARRRLREHFSLESMLRQYEELYDLCLHPQDGEGRG